MDPRVEKLAKVLIHYSLKLKKGQLIRIGGEVAAIPLLVAAYREAIEVGANPYLDVRVPEAEEILLKHGSEAQLKFISPMASMEVNRMDAMLHVWANTNTRYLSGVDSKSQSMRQKARHPLQKKLFARFASKSATWVGTQFPTQADAQDADMSLTDYEDFVYKAGHIYDNDPVKYWLGVKKEQDRLIKLLNKIDRLHIQSADTDLKLRVKGRKWINCAGTENFPDGEVFTSPLEDTAEGHIRYSYPAVYGGREVEDVRLEFRKGKVVKESAGKNQQFLTTMLDSDRGARFIGEVAIGTNYEITRFSKNILFDEKIGGTCHLAVGASIPESGGKNQSSVHWDMVCNLKKDSQITGDGKVIYRNGKFTI